MSFHPSFFILRGEFGRGLNGGVEGVEEEIDEERGVCVFFNPRADVASQSFGEAVDVRSLVEAGPLAGKIAKTEIIGVK